MKKQSLALHFYKSVSLDLREEFQSVQSHNSTEKCGEYDEGAVCLISKCDVLWDPYFLCSCQILTYHVTNHTLFL